jgi:TPR repeat protein
MEQNYDKFGPWTDIYALGATLYNLLTNKRPPLPSDIDDDETEDKHEALPFPNDVSESLKSLVLQMMKTNRTKRPQSVESLLDCTIEDEGKTIKSNKSENSFDAECNSNFIQEEVESTILEFVIQNKKNNDKVEHDQLADEIPIKEVEVQKKNKWWIYIAVIVIIACIGSYLYIKPNCKEEYSTVYEIYRASKSTKEEKEMSIKKFSELAEKKYGPAIYMLGVVSRDKDLIEAEKYFSEAMKYLPQEAEAGDMYAQCCLGEYIIQDSLKAKEAFSWFMKSAEQGLTIAMTNVGDCYITGIGVDVNKQKALLWYEKASQSGDDMAQYNLGFFYESGMLDVVDSTKAFKLFEESAKQGNANSMTPLGRYYRDGSVVKKDMLKAFNWYMKAAEKGDYEGCFNVGLFYRFGRDPFEVVDENLPEAIKFFNKALECETPYDYLRVHGWLAYCYQETKDYDKMFEHFNIAAENNDAEAQYELSLCYKTGLGVEANQKLAKMWRKKAIENGYKEQ